MGLLGDLYQHYGQPLVQGAEDFVHNNVVAPVERGISNVGQSIVQGAGDAAVAAGNYVQQQPILNAVENYGQSQVLDPITQGIADYQTNQNANNPNNNIVQGLMSAGNIVRGGFNMTPLGVAANAAISQGAGTIQAMRGIDSTPGQNFGQGLQLSQGAGITNPWAAGAVDTAANLLAVNPEGVIGGIKNLGNINKEAGLAKIASTAFDSAKQIAGFHTDTTPKFFGPSNAPTVEDAIQSGKNAVRDMGNKNNMNRAADTYNAEIPDRSQYTQGNSNITQVTAPITRVFNESTADDVLRNGLNHKDINPQQINYNEPKVQMHFDGNTGDLLSWNSERPEFAKGIVKSIAVNRPGSVGAEPESVTRHNNGFATNPFQDGQYMANNFPKGDPRGEVVDAMNDKTSSYNSAKSERDFMHDSVGKDNIKSITKVMNSKAYQNGKIDSSNFPVPHIDEMAANYGERIGRPDLSTDEFINMVHSQPSVSDLNSMKVKPGDVPSFVKDQGNFSENAPILKPDRKTASELAQQDSFDKLRNQGSKPMAEGENEPIPKPDKATANQFEKERKDRLAAAEPIKMSNAKNAAIPLRDELAQNGPSASKISDMLYSQRELSEKMTAGRMADMPTAMKLNEEDFAKMLDVVEKKTTSTDPNINKAAEEFKGVTDRVYSDAQKNGLPNLQGKRDNYVPQIQDPAATKGKGLEKSIDYLVGTGQAQGRGDALKMIRDRLANNATSGNLTNSREFDLPGLRTKEAMVGYIHRASEAVSQHTTFGENKQNVIDLINKVGEEGGKGERVNQLFNQATDPHFFDGVGKEISKSVRSFQAVTSLGLAVLSHVPQIANLTTLTGIIRTLSSIPEALSPVGRAYIMRTGTTLDHVLEEVRSSSSGSQHDSVIGKLFDEFSNAVTAPGLKNVLHFYKSLASISGKNMAEDLASALAKDPLNSTIIKQLRDLGIDHLDVLKQDGSLTLSQSISASRKVAEKMIGRYDPQDLPSWATTPLGRVIFQFKAPLYNQSKFLYNDVIKPAIGQGPSGQVNLLPMVKFLSVGIPLSMGANAVKDELRMSDTSKKTMGERVTKSAIGMTGVAAPLIEATINSIKKPQSAADEISGLIGGPTMSLIQKTGKNLSYAANGKYAPIEKELASKIPIVGSAISNYMGNKNTGTPTNQVADLGGGKFGFTDSAGKSVSYSNKLLADAAFAKDGVKSDPTTTKSADGNIYYQTQAGSVGSFSTKNLDASYSSYQKIQKSDLPQETKDQMYKQYNIPSDQYTDRSSESMQNKVSNAQYTVDAKKAKDAKDIKGWLTATDNQITSMKKAQSQLSPSTSLQDQTTYLQMQSQIMSLTDQAEKYYSQGGFKKASSGGGGSSSKSAWGPMGSPTSTSRSRFGRASASHLPKMKMHSVKAPRGAKITMVKLRKK